MASNTAEMRTDAPGFERSQIVQVAHAGRLPYLAAIEWQQHRAAQVAVGSAPEIVVLLEHEPVYTQGRRGGRDHVLQPLAAPVIDSDRGGDVTFHGPGQLVLWPILRLRERGIGIAAYVRALEECARLTARHFGVPAQRVRGRHGLWLEQRKLASVGVRIQSGVSRHGIALNCDLDLRWFDGIRACGIEGAAATSLSEESGRRIGVADAETVIVQHVAAVFGLRLAPIGWKG